MTAASVMHEWRFGVGQSAREESAEIARALALGLSEAYAAGQTEARESEKAAEGESKRRNQGRHLRRTEPRTSSPCDIGGQSPLPSAAAPVDPSGLSELDALLVCHAQGTLEPLPVDLPELPVDAPPLARLVVEDMALLFGLRLAALDDRPVPVSCRWQADRLRLHYKSVNRMHRYLVEVGVLRSVGAMPSRGGKRGTRLYAPGSESDGMPGPVLEPGPVTVEREDVVPRGAVEPAVEAVDETGVGDAIGRRPTGTLNSMVAVERAAVAVEAVHAAEAYAEGRRPTPERLTERALQDAEPGRRNERGVWLACQLRDNRYGFDDALTAMFDFARRVPPSDHPYTERHATRTLASVYRRAPRAPWGLDELRSRDA